MFGQRMRLIFYNLRPNICLSGNNCALRFQKTGHIDTICKECLYIIGQKKGIYNFKNKLVSFVIPFCPALTPVVKFNGKGIKK